ncbi:MAG: lipoyl protein ligase domain-containing protein [Acidimicrobiales bacterium]
MTAPWSSLADVEQFRRQSQRSVAVRRVDHPTLVLGSTQTEEVLSRPALRTWPGEVVRRRGGGGAVLLLAGDHLWLDAWIPREDRLWDVDASEAATWVGEWWRHALGVIGIVGCDVHRGRALPGHHDLVCFSGRGPGEVFHRAAKVVGVSQWRSREGALFHTCAYTHWDAAPLVDLLDLDEPTRVEWCRQLGGSAIGVEDLISSGTAVAALTEVLLASFPDWG